MNKVEEQRLPFKINLQLFAKDADDDKEVDGKVKDDKKTEETIDLEKLKKEWESDLLKKLDDKEKAKEAQKKQDKKDEELADLKKRLEKKETDESDDGVIEKGNSEDKPDFEKLYKQATSQASAQAKAGDDALKLAISKIEELTEDTKFEKFKNTITKKVSDNEELTKLVDRYLADGTIKNIDDYNKIVAPQEDFYKKLKDQNDTIKSYGQDSNKDYPNKKSSNVDANPNNKADSKEDEYWDKLINKKFGRISKK